MLSWLRTIRRLWRSPAPETSRLLLGSTGAGKSEAELADLVRLADRRDCAVVVLDGHGPLALHAAGHWAARGHEGRMVYEPLADTERVLCWPMLPRSSAPSLSRRLLEDSENRQEVAQCFLAQRNLATLNDRPWTLEWVHAAIDLCLAQPQEEPLPSLLFAFRTGSAAYERLLGDCRRPEVVEKFRNLERLRRKNEVQFETLTGAARRLLELVCTSEIVRLRSRPGPFDWLDALRQSKLIAFDGGGIRSREVKRTVFLLVSLHVIHGVRRHFAQTGQPLPVVLVLEEAGVLGLVTPFILAALGELRKARLSIHIITQSGQDFDDRSQLEALLANTPSQAFFQCLSPADQELGAKALANATFDPLAVHYTRTRTLLRPRQREVVEAYYKNPQLQEQEFRTALATLRVGERFVRDRGGVRRERVRPLRLPVRPRSAFEAFAREAVSRVRRQPIYLPVPAPQPPTAPDRRPSAATRLRERRGHVPVRPAGEAAAPP